jgi:mannose-1-phosphate guanylyltransferase
LTEGGFFFIVIFVMENLYAIILAGGRGERFWPWSTKDKPKQLLPLVREKTMLEETIERVAPLVPLERVRIVTTRDLVHRILGGISQLKEENLIIEPFGRNTAAAIGLAALSLGDPQAIMFILSTDHLIKPQVNFLQAVSVAVESAQSGDWLLTFGINPTRAETGYGYIQVGELLEEVSGIRVYKAVRFKEKPDGLTAQEFYYQKNIYLWNSGMFIWRVSAILSALQSFLPNLYEGLSRVVSSSKGETLLDEVYSGLQPTSVDHGVMEKAKNVLVVRGEFFWEDIGSWTSLEKIYQKDDENNIKLGNVCALDTFDTLLIGDQDGVLAALGVSDLIIIKTGRSVLVTHKTKAQEVKRLVEKMGKEEKFRGFI